MDKTQAIKLLARTLIECPVCYIPSLYRKINKGKRISYCCDKCGLTWVTLNGYPTYTDSNAQPCGSILWANMDPRTTVTWSSCVLPRGHLRTECFRIAYPREVKRA